MSSRSLRKLVRRGRGRRERSIRCLDRLTVDMTLDARDGGGGGGTYGRLGGETGLEEERGGVTEDVVVGL